jgi:hypothetical protein
MHEQDPNTDRVRIASRNMAASLAVSLAAVTCRDALNSGLMSHLLHALETVVASHAINDVATLLCRINHPVGCEYVERMALDRAMKDIEDHMAPVCLSCIITCAYVTFCYQTKRFRCLLECAEVCQIHFTV